VAYPDPIVGTVAAPTNQVNPIRPTQRRSARSAAPTGRYVVAFRGG
jgi:hypothetical protein